MRHVRVARAILRPAFAVSVGLMVSARAWSKDAQDYQSNVGAPYPQVAVVAPPRVEIEADGLPTQPQPLIRPRREPDDSREPFSPNYGPAPEPVRPKPVRQPAAPLRAAQAVLAEPRHAMSEAEANALIARAISAHEARYP